jgi:hypothetical protein|tara:strand:- start:586 stop:1071 length:486 start_codon:yes stop_codon:yes gene_type:complete
MQITVSKINPPRPGDPEKGWKPTKNYQIYDESGTKLLASQDKGIGSVQVGDVIEIQTSQPDRYGNVYIQSFEPSNVTDINQDMQKIKQTFPDAKVVSDYSTVQPSASSNTMTPKDFLIVLQSCVNRQADWTPQQKLKFVLDNYKAGMEATHNRLSNAEDSF